VSGHNKHKTSKKHSQHSPSLQQPSAPSVIVVPTSTTPSSPEPDGAPKLGTEAWLKLATVVIAFLYVSGHAASTAFTQSFNLQPEDFAWSEQDFLLHGLHYLLPDSHYDQDGFYTRLLHLPWLLWMVYALLFPLIFWHRVRPACSHRPAWISTMVRSALLVPLALALDGLSGREGRIRAERINLQDSPTVTVFFQVPACETNDCYVEGKLLSRTSKSVFVADPLEYADCSGLQTEFPQDQLVVVPADNVSRVHARIPVKRQSALRNKLQSNNP